MNKMRFAEVGFVALVLVTLVLSLSAVRHSAAAEIPAGSTCSSTNALYLSVVLLGALSWGVAFRRERDWILGVWTNHFLSTLVALPVLASFFYWALTIGALVLYPLSAVGVVDVVKALDFTGLGSLLVHSIPAKTYCQDLLQHPFALVVSAALVAYYLSIATVWAEGSSPIFHSYPQLGHASQASSSNVYTSTPSSSLKGSSTMPLTTSSRHSSSSLKTSSASYPYTRAGSFTSQTSSAPLSAIMSTTPVTSKILITGLSINRVLSNSPILNPTPVLRQLSLSVRNLSSTHIFASTASEAHTADTHSSVQNDATSGNAEHRAEANNTSDAVVSTESTVAVKRTDEVVEGDSSMAKERASLTSNNTYRWNHGSSGSVSEIEPVIIELQAVAQTGGKELIPAVPARARRSSSLKAAMNTILLPVRATKKSLASASFVRKQSLTRSTSSSPDPTITPTPSPASPRRTSSLKKTVSNIQNNAGCFGKSAVRG